MVHFAYFFEAYTALIPLLPDSFRAAQFHFYLVASHESFCISDGAIWTEVDSEWGQTNS